MEQRVIGRSQLSVSVLGLGCNNFGWRIEAEPSNRVIGRALELGINFFDTADVYGDSEVILGKALAPHRKRVIIATKFGIARQGLAGGASRAYVMQAVERSLRRLGTDYIDLYYLHRPDPAVPIEETLRALEALVRRGAVRYAAASNMTPELLSEAARMAGAVDFDGFVATQEHYNLLERGIEKSLAPAAERLGLALIPYFPLASGMLTGKYHRGAKPSAGSRLAAWNHLSSSLLTEQNFDTVGRLEAFAAERGHTIGELAIAWLLARSSVPSVIAGATQPGQLEANCSAVAWKLSPGELAEIDRLVPSG